MAKVYPFRAIRPPSDLACRVASPPYDVISTAEARELVRENAFSYLHVSRAEVDLPEGTDEHDIHVHEQARNNLQRFIQNGTLVQDANPQFYLYAQTMGKHRQVGLVTCVSVDEYDTDRIKKHEKTRADKEDDRTQHIDILGAHDEPVFLTYRANAKIDQLVASVCAKTPDLDMTTPDSVRHTLWVVGDGSVIDQLKQLFENVSCLYVADGHHRSAAASRVHSLRKGKPGEHGVFLAVVFPHNQMQIMPYNRVVRDLRGRSTEQILKDLSRVMDLQRCEREAIPQAAREFGVYINHTWYLGKVRSEIASSTDPVESLDCSICQNAILAPLFDVANPRADKHIDFIGGIRGHRELERLVDEGKFTIAFHLFPTQVEQLIQVSDAGLLMPPKSTWFEPKLRSGLFLHLFE